MAGESRATWSLRRTTAALILLLIIGSSAYAFWWTLSLRYTVERRSRLLALVQGFEFLDTTGITLQRYRSDCGPAALHMVLSHYGITTTLDVLEQQMMDSPGGTSVRRMKEVAEQYGLAGRATGVTGADLSRMPLPSIALYRGHHFIIIESRSPDGSQLTVVDPSIGRCHVSAYRFLQACDGRVLVLWKPGYEK